MAREVRCHQTDRQTDRHDNYSNPRCACAPRVNKLTNGLRQTNETVVCQLNILHYFTAISRKDQILFAHVAIE